MAGIFSTDHPVWNFLGKLTDMVLLTGLWILCSIPLVTIGAATAALYDVSFQMAENQEGYIVRSFFKSFRKNWKRATAVWLITAGLGILLASDVYVYSRMESLGVVLLTASVIAAVIYAMMLLYLFPLIVKSDLDLKSAAAAAFVLALRNPGWTVFMLVAAAGILAAGIFVLAPLLVVGAGLTAYLHCKLLRMLLENEKREAR